MSEPLKTTAIVCRYADYGEHNRMLTLLTPEQGTIEAAAYACRRPKSPLYAGCSLFAYGEYVLRERSGKLSVAQFDFRESFAALSEELGKLAIAAYVALSSAQHAHSGDAGAFLLCYHTLSFLSYGTAHPVDLFACFLVKQLDLTGYRPNLTHCVRCGKALRSAAGFSCEQGGVVCEDCLGAGDERLELLAAEAMRRMEALPLEEMGKVALPGALRGQLLRVLLLNAEYRGLQPAKMQGIYKQIRAEYEKDFA